ncbi:glycosyltransferase family 4 protein [Haloarcula mannanilytica]|uniref:glycosyltransferase family 4 protein n=1 Tax=Haloarcula mannanilytica TaxID=2509225 RepID=UPI001F28C211|nr:glycosyltransferase family 4 protein [Haloarcula mannanilytica]
MASLDICFVVNAVGEGSIPAEIATAVTRHTDHTVDILTWFNSGQFAGEELLDVRSLDAPDTALGIDSDTYHRAARILSEYDLVQAHHNHSAAFTKVIARRVGVPAVSREGNTRDGFTRKGRIANGVTNPLARRVVCISDSVYQSFTRWERAILPKGKVRQIPNGVHIDRIDETAPALPDGVTPADDAFLIGNAAMLYEQKAQDTLIRAVAELNDRADRPVELIICGDGPERARLESLAETLGIRSQVSFAGLVGRRAVYAMAKAVDAFAMPSRWEGFCSAVAEALAAETATVLSDIDTFRELYDGAALYHAVDNVGGLTDCLEMLLTDESRRESLAQAGRDLVEEKYTITAVAKQYGALYDDIVE